jgi:hypothetical protein
MVVAEQRETSRSESNQDDFMEEMAFDLNPKDKHVLNKQSEVRIVEINFRQRSQNNQSNKGRKS